MIKQASVALTAGVLAAGLTLAPALAMPAKSAMNAPATLALTATQQKTAWNDLHTQNMQKNVPSSFHARVGEKVPGTLAIKPIGGKVAKNIPALVRYDFATIKNKVLIVDPANKTIAEVLRG